MNKQLEEIVIKRYLQWSLLVIVSVIYAVFVSTKIPTIAVWLVTADQLTIPSFIVDIVTNHSDFFGWQLSRATFIFPDALVYLFIYGLGFDPVNSVIYSSMISSFFWIYLVFCCFSTTNYFSFSKKCALTLVFFYLLPLVLAQLFPVMADFIFKYLFSFFNHFSCFVISALCLVWSVDYVCNENKNLALLFLISLIVLLLTFSNPLIYIYFYIPVFLFICMIFSSADKRRRIRLLYLFFALLVAFTLGYLISTLINKQTMLPMQPVSQFFIQAKFLLKSLFVLGKENTSIALIYVFYFIIYALSLYQCWRNIGLFFRHKLPIEAEHDFFLQTILTIAGMLNFFAAIAPWDSAGSRFLMFFLFAPFLLFILIFSKPNLAYGFVFAKRTLLILALLCCVISLYMVYKSDFTLSLLKEEKENAASFNHCIKNLGLHRGLAKYWSARNNQFMSYNKLRLSQIIPWTLSKNTILFYWGNNAYSFLQKENDPDPFDFILADGIDSIDKQVLIDSFGKPGKIAHCGKRPIWIYPDSTQIFSVLIEGHNEPYLRYLYANGFVTMPAVSFRSTTGRRRVFAREAEAYRDQAGYMLYDNHILLHKGVYRFELRYRVDGALRSSDIESSSIFEIIKDRDSVQLASRKLKLFANHEIGHISLKINLAQNSVVEPRVLYSGKHQVHIDTLSIVAIK